MSFGVAPRLLHFCSCSLGRITRPKSFSIVVNNDDRTRGATQLALGWGGVFGVTLWGRRGVECAALLLYFYDVLLLNDYGDRPSTRGKRPLRIVAFGIHLSVPSSDMGG